MLVDDAQRISTALQERLDAGACQGITASVKSEQLAPKSVPAGAGRPTFTNYYIKIEDGTRTVLLTLGQGARLVDDIEPDWGPDRLFEVIDAWQADSGGS